MDISAIVSAIGSVGFPIVACGAIFWMQNNTLKEVNQAISNNTLALTRLLAKLDMDNGKESNIV